MVKTVCFSQEQVLRYWNFGNRENY